MHRRAGARIKALATARLCSFYPIGREAPCGGERTIPHMHVREGWGSGKGAFSDRLGQADRTGKLLGKRRGVSGADHYGQVSPSGRWFFPVRAVPSSS